MRNGSQTLSLCRWALIAGMSAIIGIILFSCGRTVKAGNAKDAATSSVMAGVIQVAPKTLESQLTVSSELVPFQEIDVYAKESGYVQKLSVDYGSRVQAGQIMAVLEIPELEAQVQQDDAMIDNATEQVTHASHELGRVEAQQKVLQLEFDRLNGVAKSNPGLVARQEVDDAEGKALASAAQVEAAKSSLEAARSQLLAAKAKRQHDQFLFNYSKITAPFAGVVTQRYANLGTLMQAGTNSSTQVLPLVRLSQDDLFRLVIPIPESYAHYIRIGDPVDVLVTSLNRHFLGKVARFSMQVKEETRTMHTEVDVSNPSRILMPGLYAEATLTVERKQGALAVPLQAVNHEGTHTTVYAIGPEDKIEDREVKLGLQTDNDAEVLAGVTSGEMVVVSDRSALKPGQTVQPQVVRLLQYQGRKEE